MRAHDSSERGGGGGGGDGDTRTLDVATAAGRLRRTTTAAAERQNEGGAEKRRLRDHHEDIIGRASCMDIELNALPRVPLKGGCTAAADAVAVPARLTLNRPPSPGGSVDRSTPTPSAPGLAAGELASSVHMLLD